MSYIDFNTLRMDNIYLEKLKSMKDHTCKLQLKDICEENVFETNILEFFLKCKLDKSLIFLLNSSIYIDINSYHVYYILENIIINYDKFILIKVLENYPLIKDYFLKTKYKWLVLTLDYENISILYYFFAEYNMYTLMQTRLLNRIFDILNKNDTLFKKKIIDIAKCNVHTLYNIESILFRYPLLSFDIFNLEEKESDFIYLISSLISNNSFEYFDIYNTILLLFKKKRKTSIELFQNINKIIMESSFVNNKLYAWFLKEYIIILEQKFNKKDITKILGTFKLNYILGKKNALVFLCYAESYFLNLEELMIEHDNYYITPIEDCIRYGSFKTLVYLLKDRKQILNNFNVINNTTEQNVCIETIFDLSISNNDTRLFEFLLSHYLDYYYNRHNFLRNLINNILTCYISDKRKKKLFKIAVTYLKHYFNTNTILNTIIYSNSINLFKYFYDTYPVNFILDTLNEFESINVGLFKTSYFQKALFYNLKNQYEKNPDNQSIIKTMKIFYIKRIGLFRLNSYISKHLLGYIKKYINIGILIERVLLNGYGSSITMLHNNYNKTYINEDLAYIKKHINIVSNIAHKKRVFNIDDLTVYTSFNNVCIFTLMNTRNMFTNDSFSYYNKINIAYNFFINGLFPVFYMLIRNSMMKYNKYHTYSFYGSNYKNTYTCIRVYLFFNRFAYRINLKNKKKMLIHKKKLESTLHFFKICVHNEKKVHKYIKNNVYETLHSNYSICNSHPEHVTPIKLLQFIENKNQTYLTEKADGIKKYIYLNTYYPLILDDTRYQVEEVIIENVKVCFICSDLNTIMKLRQQHPYVNSFTKDNETNALRLYIKENKMKRLWWPKMVWKIDITKEFDSLKTKHYSIFPTDGWILFKRFDLETRFLKVKPDNQMTIDLLYKDHEFYSQEGPISPLKLNLICNKELENDCIYRCYPLKNNSWEPREKRTDKKLPNTLSIINTVLHSLKRPWCIKDIESYIKSYYHLDYNMYNPWKKLICNESLYSIISRYSKNKSILDLGCGHISEKIIKISSCSDYTGIDIDYSIINKYNQEKINNKSQYYTLDASQNWDAQIDLFEYHDFTEYTYDVILSLFSIHNIKCLTTFERQLNKISKKGTKIIIKFLELDSLHSVFSIYGNILRYESSYVKYNDDKSIKYYYTHTHKKPIIERVYSYTELKDAFSKRWRIVVEHSNTTGDTEWSMYMNCFITVMFEKI